MTGSKLASVEFADNPEPRCACVLLLDTSGSMRGEKIKALNDGLRVFRDELNQNALAALRVEVAVVTFDSQVNVVRDFVTADQFDPPELTPTGTTAMGAGIWKALDLIAARKAEYRAAGIAYYRPWVFLITDGAPTDSVEVEAAAARVVSEERAKHVAFFAVGVDGADLNRLTAIGSRTPLKLSGLNFGDLFVWLSDSMQCVSHSKPGDQLALPPPGWSAI